MISKKHILLILLSVLAVWRLPAQVAERISIPFECDFEDATENSKWVLNDGTAKATDQWIIGRSARNGGERGLYISSHTTPTSDGMGGTVAGDSAALFGAAKNRVVAYRKFRVPHTTAPITSYDICFDWKMLGNAAEPAKAQFYVFFGPAIMLTQGNYPYLNYVSATSGLALPTRMQGQFCPFEVDGKTRQVWNSQNGSKNWKHAHTTKVAPFNVSASASDEEFVLLFMWVNNTTNAENTSMGICIDNVQISSAAIARPDNFKAVLDCANDGLALSWESTADYIELQYRTINDDDWVNTIMPISGQSYSLHLRKEGLYNLRIRGYKERESMDDDISAWAVVNDVIYWCPGNTCIDYIDLEGPNTTCRYGKFASAEGIPPSDATLTGGYMPDGSYTAGQEDNWEEYACHRVMWEQEYDPCTLNSTDPNGNPVPGLQRVPDGVMATVRLGNPHTSYGHEDITYKMTVDANFSLLIVHYAYVGQTATHPGLEGFEIQLLDQNMHVMDTKGCMNPSFEYNEDVLGNVWNVSGDNKYRWSNWSAFGFDLSAYQGRTVYLRIHNWDCGAGGHSGHMYFYLNCASASLNTDNCGAEETVSVDAPEGFVYEWYDEYNILVGTDKVLKNVQSGHHNYRCHMCMVDPSTGQPTNCCLDLQTTLEPRYPVPEIEWKHTPKDCQNIVEFTDKSHVVVRYTDDQTGQEVEALAPNEHIDLSELWMYDHVDGRLLYHTVEPAFTYYAPDLGQVVDIKQRAVFGGGTCFDEKTTTITIPSILTDPVIVDATICANQVPFRFDNKGFYETTIGYRKEAKNYAGCDSLTILNLTVNPVPEVSVYDTVCSSNLPFRFNGYDYINTDRYTQRLESQLTGCDSMVTLYLKVIERLNLDVDTMPQAYCSDDGSLVIAWDNMLNNRQQLGEFDSLTVVFSDNALLTGMFANTTVTDNSTKSLTFSFTDELVPDRYYVTLTFYQHRACDPQSFVIPIDIQYGSIIRQKWNDALVLLNEDYNHGYKFTAYQWYKNGVAIAGETLPYLYGSLDFSATYTVRLTRQDGVVAFACPFTPTDRSGSNRTSFPTFATEGSVVQYSAQTQTTVSIFTLTGQLYSIQQLNEGSASVRMPLTAGVYTIRIEAADEPILTQPLMIGR